MIKNLINHLFISSFFSIKSNKVFIYITPKITTSNKNRVLFFKIYKHTFFLKTFVKNRNRNYNFYEVLGVEKNSTNEKIKEAYLKLAKQYHPDVNADPGSVDKFKTITLAYEALNNERNRDLYDAYMYNDPYSTEWKYKEEHYREDSRANNSNNFYKEKARYDNYSQNFYREQNESNFWQGRKEQYEGEFHKDYESAFAHGFKSTKPQKGEDIKVNNIYIYCIARNINTII